MKRKWRTVDQFATFLVIISLFIVGCAPYMPSTSLSSDTFSLQKQIKLTFKPDRGTYLTDKDISELFEKAKSAGLELDYWILRIDEKSGKLLLRKYPIKADVFVDVMENRQLAYVYITIFGDSQTIIDSAMIEFKNKYKSKFH
jgi:hypothetical protein